MNWQLDKNRPICPQLEEQICVRIAQGEFRPGDRMLSVRDMALDAGVNPNTVQKSFEELERMGLLYSQRSSGWYVSDCLDTARHTLEQLFADKTASYFGEMAILGLTEEQIKDYVAGWPGTEDEKSMKKEGENHE